MNRERRILNLLAVLAIGAFLVATSAAPVAAQGKDIAGSYWALLNLDAIVDGGRVETLGVILDQNGAVLFTSEHEADKESPGVGAWRHLPGGLIGMGASSFRFGPNPVDSICALIGVDSPPDNCVLKVGGTLSRDGAGGPRG